MGFNVQLDTFPLAWVEEVKDEYGNAVERPITGLEGLIVIGKMVSIGDYFASIDRDGQEMIEWFMENALESWNVELAGRPVPMTVEGMLSLPRWLVSLIIRRWQRGIATVDGPLGRTSSVGATSQGLNLPMKVLSPNPPN